MVRSDFPWNIEETLNIAEIARLIHMVILKDFAAISEKKFYHVIHSHLTSPVKGGGTLLYAPEGRVKIMTHPSNGNMSMTTAIKSRLFRY